ncbi:MULTISPECIES: non-homologous end joining protein Ku [Streptomyces]|uniref:Non-homologous end joining protein Ku n=1 Tax=Streptomyces antimycoticus TaxID=68175 RepID=A0ABD5J0D4_9ACTN|nr:MULTISPECIES: Ku protein [Streptomyces]MEE4581816.1 Ku protein [Streptomyces sp. DSM 41602]RSS47451.1 Ku protein [Streptomyces sp. WAC05858]
MRAIWSGTISFGLVALPCQLFTATEEHGPGLHTVHVACGGRIRHRRVCELENVEVQQTDIARAWEAPDGRQVILRDTDLEALPLPTKHVIEVLGFVRSEEVDPILYSRPYWIGASGAGAQRPYALLVEALARSGRVAICKVAIRSRERLAALRPRHGMLLLQTLLWPEEVRDPGDLSSPAPLTDRELAMAEVLMDALAGVDIDQLHDEYTAALNSLIDAKAGHGELTVTPEPAPAIDLMAALEESVRAAKRSRGEDSVD